MRFFKVIHKHLSYPIVNEFVPELFSAIPALQEAEGLLRRR